MKSGKRRAVVTLAGLLMVSCCAGWGEDGHRIISDIARRELSSAAAKAVNDLLDGKSLADVCTWADEIRPQVEYKWSERLHYVNIDPSVTSFDYRRDCPTGECVVGAIYRFIPVLRDAEADRKARAEALKFLAHFVEDVHQPLHVSPAGDRGGNDVKVEFFGQAANLHEVWDTLILRQTDRPWKEYAERLAGSIRAEDRREWSRLDPSAWATESYRLAVSHAHVIPDDHRLGSAYQERNLPVVEQRLRMGGVRLALLLNAIFGDGQELPRAPATSSAPASAPASSATAP